jgi:hypothetical protein
MENFGIGRFLARIAKAIANTLTLVACLASARVCMAGTKVHLLVIGNNASFVDPRLPAQDPPPPMLHFADDDAASFYELFSETADSGHLLTVMDSDSDASYPGLAALARPPTRAELAAAIDALSQRMVATREQGDHNVLFLFFSGHGVMVDGKGAELSLLDGGISHEFLYDEILAKLPADYVHIFVDACHAEAIVRPRDGQASSVRITPADANALLVHSTLARFPHVGAIVAASSDTQAHEWDVLRHGVFTHELLSGLRGADEVDLARRLDSR